MFVYINNIFGDPLFDPTGARSVKSPLFLVCLHDEGRRIQSLGACIDTVSLENNNLGGLYTVFFTIKPNIFSDKPQNLLNF